MNLELIIQTVGYPAVCLLVMGECMGVPLPGETALLIAAAAAGAGTMFHIWWVIAAAAGGAIVGDTFGYWIGRRGGRALLERLMRRFKIKPDHLIRAETFFARHGGKAVFFGRSVSYLRVLTALLAGVSHMQYPRFLCWNALGGIAWACVFGLAGFYFGKNLGLLKEYIHELALGTTIVLVLGAGFYFLGRRLGWFDRKK